MKKVISSSVIMIIAVILLSADSVREIKGKVTDDHDVPVAGVNVFIKNSSRAVVTDIEGKYRISVLQSDKILVFACAGYRSREIRIENQETINIVLYAEQAETEDHYIKGPAVQRIKVASGQVASESKKVFNYSAPMNYPLNIGDFNTEGYSAIHENGYKDVLKQPISTFSIDVDKASYSNVRRFINMGKIPPTDAVRIEEMINYFSYDYPEPDGKHPFSVYTELSECPWNHGHQLLHIGLKGKSMDKSELPASNLVFLIDVSGSMNFPNKLPLLKSAFELLVKELRSIDRVAIVVYAGAAGVVLKSTPGNNKEVINNSLNQLQAGGSTAGGQGIMLAYKIASDNFIRGGNNRIILATDGDFNVGSSSNAEMERLIEKEREKGVFITVLGFGMSNYKDDKMEIIADKGNGNYAYIDNIQEARKVLVGEFAGTLFTIAKDVKFQLEFNPERVKAYRLIGYENRLLNDEDFNNDKKDAGEMGSGHTVTALYELIPAGSEETHSSIDPLKYQSNVKPVKADVEAELLTIKLRYKQVDGKTSILYEIPVKVKLLPIANCSDNFRFAASVAEFGMVLRDSEFKAGASYDHLLSLAQSARGIDEEGYRGEFIRLVKTAQTIKEAQAVK
jgi:Ca-activated chloride channel homolog